MQNGRDDEKESRYKERAYSSMSSKNSMMQEVEVELKQRRAAGRGGDEVIRRANQKVVND